MAENLRIRIASLEKVLKTQNKKKIDDGFTFVLLVDIDNAGFPFSRCFRQRGQQTEAVSMRQFVSRLGGKNSVRVLLPTAPDWVQQEYGKHIDPKKIANKVSNKLIEELAIN